MKTKEELAALKKEIEALNNKLAELSEEELTQVCGSLRQCHAGELPTPEIDIFKTKRCIEN